MDQSPNCTENDLESPTSTIQSQEDLKPGVKPVVYKRRWILLLAVSILVFSNSMSRLAFGPIAYTSAVFYDTEIGVINWFAMVYMVAGIPTGLVATYAMDKIGLRLSLIIASWVHLIGCVLRSLSSIPDLFSREKLILVFTGHVLSAIAQPFFMFAPTKVAAAWFPETQRATANTIATVCNPLGILAANVLSPLIVRKPEDIVTMLYIYAIPAAIGAIIASVGIKTDNPPSPPSISAEKSEAETFWIGVKKLVYNIQYWILILSIGGGIGIYTALTVFLEQILCPKGYSDIFIGVVCGSCLVVSGVFGALITGKIADKTKHISSVAKICYIFCAGAVATFSFLKDKHASDVIVAVSCGLIGFFALPLLPLGNELVVETTFPTNPSTSAGLLFLAGQVQGLILIIILQKAASPIELNQTTNATSCVSENDLLSSTARNNPIVILDMTVPCYVLLGYACLVCLCFVLFFRNSKRRSNLESKGFSQRPILLCPTKKKKMPLLRNISVISDEKTRESKKSKHGEKS